MNSAAHELGRFAGAVAHQRALEWRTLDWLPAYEISECGRVRRRIDGSNRRAGFQLKSFINRDGYVRYTLQDADGCERSLVASRLVCEAWHGPPPFDGAQAAHGDGDTLNNHFWNLRWATPKENTHDKYAHGTVLLGEAHPKAKLTSEQVAEIRAKFVGHVGQLTDLAREYGVNRSTISRIVTNKYWAVADPRGSQNRITHGRNLNHGTR